MKNDTNHRQVPDVARITNARKAAAVRAACQSWGMEHGDDLEFDDSPAVSLGSDDGETPNLEGGAFVAAWVWVTPEQIDEALEQVETYTCIQCGRVFETDDHVAVQCTGCHRPVCRDDECGTNGEGECRECGLGGKLLRSGREALARNQALPECRICGSGPSPENPIDMHSDACRNCIDKDELHIQGFRDPVRCAECGTIFELPAVAVCPKPECGSRQIRRVI